MAESIKPCVGVVLVNLGTPDEATPSAVRRFLAEFLADPRVIEIPRPIWWLIRHLFILPLRPYRVARLYQAIWANDSPMREILKAQSVQLAEQLRQSNVSVPVEVVPGMTYGSPSLAKALDDLGKKGAESIIVLPLFPQYSATSTAPVYDVVQRWSAAQRNLPAITLIKDYYQHPLYIQALSNQIKAYWQQHGKPDRLLFSFHGIPQPYADKGDPYPERCRKTAVLVATALGLSDDEWCCAFQSRFGAQPWVQPYTDDVLGQWGKQGLETVHVTCPGFSADCLETLEEIALQNKEHFLQSGGKKYAYIPALNAEPAHISLLAALVQPGLESFQQLS